MITIGALSKRTGVNIETIRYYERIRLIPPPPARKVDDDSTAPRTFGG